MRRILVRKYNDIPFISFFDIPHSCSFHTVKGKAGETSNYEVGRIENARKIYDQLVLVGLMPNLYTESPVRNGNDVFLNGYYALWKSYQVDEAGAKPNMINKMATIMKEMTGRGFSFDATKALLLANVIRENQSFLNMIVERSRRELTHATTGIEKEISALRSEVKKVVAEMKRTAKTDKKAIEVLGREFFNLRRQITILKGCRAQMGGIATHMQVISSQSSVAAGMKRATKQMDPAKQAKVMQDFQRQSAQLDVMNEMMSDAIDDVIDNDEAEEETEDLTNQVVDEIGVNVASQLSVAPKGKIAGKRMEELSSSRIDELEKILDGFIRDS